MFPDWFDEVWGKAKDVASTVFDWKRLDFEWDMYKDERRAGLAFATDPYMQPARSSGSNPVIPSSDSNGNLLMWLALVGVAIALASWLWPGKKR